jgi:hypothetical protein
MLPFHQFLTALSLRFSETSGDLSPALSHFVDHALDHQAFVGGDGLSV